MKLIPDNISKILLLVLTIFIIALTIRIFLPITVKNEISFYTNRTGLDLGPLIPAPDLEIHITQSER